MTRFRNFLSAVMLAVGIMVPTMGNAAVVPPATLTTPSGLHPGDQYRIVFITSTTRDGNAQISDFNSFVNTAANAPGSLLAPLGATWNTIASTSSVSAFNNIGGASSLPMYLLDGTLVANNTTDLWDGSIAHAINMTETGGLTPQTRVFTGTSGNGSIASGVGNGSFQFATTGAPYFSDGNWIQSNAIQNRFANAFYGISSPITVAAIPEPSTMVLGGIALAGLLAVARQRRARDSG